MPVGMGGNKYTRVLSAMSSQFLFPKISDASHFTVPKSTMWREIEGDLARLPEKRSGGDNDNAHSARQ